MALLKSSNAELGNYSVEGWTRGSATQEVVRDNSVTPHSGSWSWIVAGDGLLKNCYLPITALTSGRWLFMRAWVRLNNLPTSGEDLQCRPYAGASSSLWLEVQTDGRLRFPATVANLLPVTFSPALSVGTWYKLEWAMCQPTPQGLFSIARLNDVEFARTMGRNALNLSGISRYIANAGSTVVCRQNLDDIVLNDDTGSGNCYWNDADKPRSSGKSQPSVRSVTTPLDSPTPSLNIVVNAPPTIVPGDLLVAVLNINGGRTFTGLPSGWSIVGSGALSSTVVVAIKRATSSEPSSYTFTINLSSASITTCYALASVDSASPVIDSLVTAASYGGNTTPVFFPGLDVSDGDALVLQVVGHTAAPTIAVPGSWGSVSEAKNGTSNLELRTGFLPATDGGLFMGPSTLASANLSGYGVASVAFRGVVPAQNKYMAVA